MMSRIKNKIKYQVYSFSWASGDDFDVNDYDNWIDAMKDFSERSGDYGIRVVLVEVWNHD